MEHPFFGPIEIEDGYAELQPIKVGDREITIEIDAEETPSENELNALADACQNSEVWVGKMITKFHAEFDEILRDALEVWAGDDPAFLANFASGATLESITSDQVAQKLYLSDIRLEGDEIAMDMKFDVPTLDYLICGRFEPDGSLSDVTLES